jgi:hypothetical protein
VPKFIESTRHQIDAAADEVNSKICSFAKNGISIGQGLISRLREQIRYEPVRALSQDLEVFCQALEAINCPLETFSIDEAIKQIGVAGQALENARRTADSILHSPSMLLPGSAATLVRDWSSLVTSLHESYKALKDIADNGQDILIKSIPNIAESAKRNANLLVAAELNAAYSQLSHCMEKIRAASLPVDRQIEHFLEFYQKYEAVYAGMVGWYREIDANKNEYQRLLKPIADELILSTSKTSTSYAKMVIANVEEPLKKLDSDLRHWPEKVQEDARAFFRRFEPSLLCLSDALLHLLNLSTTTANHLPQYVHDIRKSLDELERGVEEQKQLVSSNSAFYTYLNNITVEKARLGLASAAMELRNAEVVIGGQKKPVNEVLGDFESILTKNDAVVLLPVIQAARKAWQKGIQTGEDTEKLLSTTYSVVQICVIARPGIEVIMPGITELHENVVRIVTAVHDAMKKWVLAVAPLSSSVPLWLQQIKTYGYLFAPEFINKLDSLYGSLKSARDELIKDNPPLDQSASPAFQKIPKAIAEIKDSWSQLAMQLKALGDAPNRVDLSELMDRVKTDLVALIKQLIPAEVHLDLDMNTQIKDNVGSVFLAGDGKENQNSQLTLSAKIVQNLMTGSSTSEFRGSLQHFRLKLFGFLTIEFNDVTFEALKGSAPRLLPPNITDVQFEGCLSFVEQLQRAFKLKSGPYVLPLPGGIKAGYAIRPGTLPLPPMIIQDLVIDAGIEIPFDDRAATTTFAVSSRQKPALLFVAPYGGTMFFGLNMAGDRLVNVEACLDAGLVAGFDWGAVVGTGRVTLGIYFRQAGSGILLDGFFFAGGEGTVLDIVSLPLSLRIGTSWQDGAVKGYGEFSTEMGRSPFTWTLTYRVERAVNKAVAAATAKDERSNANQLPVKNLETHGKDDLFLDPQTWREFKTAFAKI